MKKQYSPESVTSILKDSGFSYAAKCFSQDFSSEVKEYDLEKWLKKYFVGIGDAYRVFMAIKRANA